MPGKKRVPAGLDSPLKDAPLPATAKPRKKENVEAAQQPTPPKKKPKIPKPESLAAAARFDHVVCQGTAILQSNGEHVTVEAGASRFRVQPIPGLTLPPSGSRIYVYLWPRTDEQARVTTWWLAKWKPQEEPGEKPLTLRACGTIHSRQEGAFTLTITPSSPNVEPFDVTLAGAKTAINALPRVGSRLLLYGRVDVDLLKLVGFHPEQHWAHLTRSSEEGLARDQEAAKSA